MSYAAKEIFYTLQGEGAQAERPAVFCRFSGCNLWSGREVDRAQAPCRFCDTDFVGTDGPGGGRCPDAASLADAVAARWPGGGGPPFVVCTGGEPLLQLDAALVDALHARGFEIAVETNGTVAPAPGGLDWICVSPKAGTPLRLLEGDELKLVVPQPGLAPEALQGLRFRRFSLQPMDGEHAPRGRIVPAPAAVATEPADPQAPRHPLSGGPRMPSAAPTTPRSRRRAMTPTDAPSHRLEGYVFLVAFCLCIPAANWLIGNAGTVCVPGGPCLIPVAPGLMAPSGVLMIGLALVLRDLVQRRLGLAWAAGAIAAGTALSALLAAPALVLASAVAFLLSEAADLAVYTPLQRRGLVAAVAASSVVGLVVDSVVFLSLAFGSLDYLAGQVAGKAWMVLLALPFVRWLRRRDQRPDLARAA
jgi:7-carboxy-7-deazaguanine synthase (Cx14CxxC type)